MSTPAPHTLTTDELLRYYPDSPLAAALEDAQRQLEQAGRTLTAARSMQEVAERLGNLVEGEDLEFFLQRLPVELKALEEARAAFYEADDGELGA